MTNAAAERAMGDILTVPHPAVAALAAAGIGSLAMVGLVVSRLRRGAPVVRQGGAEPVTWDGRDVVWIVALTLMLQSLATTIGPSPPPIRLQLVTGMLATGAAAVTTMLLLRLRGATWGMLGWRVDRWRDVVGQAVGTVLFVLAPLLALAGMLDRIVPYRHPIVDFLAEHRDAASVALVWVAATVTAPVVEEFFFRRILQGWLEQWFASSMTPRHAGIVAITGSAVAFALAHLGQGLAWVPLVGLGLVLGWLARQTGSIVPGILAHALFNAVSLVLVLLQRPSSAG